VPHRRRNDDYVPKVSPNDHIEVTGDRAVIAQNIIFEAHPLY
jgi:hypothetical protein